MFASEMRIPGKRAILMGARSLISRFDYRLADDGSFADVPTMHHRIFGEVKDRTMTGPHRIFSLIAAVEYIEKHGIPGSIVECGVWRGGSTMAATKSLANNGNTEREIYLYDTFAGMPPPTDFDVRLDGKTARDTFAQLSGRDTGSQWCYASLEDVQRGMATTNYPPTRIHFVKGKVEDTIPQTLPTKIAILRLDTDWYHSTLHELQHLYPLLQPGGILIIDDYGAWQGARKAVDEYLAENKIPIFLHRIDYTGRMGVKP